MTISPDLGPNRFFQAYGVTSDGQLIGTLETRTSDGSRISSAVALLTPGSLDVLVMRELGAIRANIRADGSSRFIVWSEDSDESLQISTWTIWAYDRQTRKTRALRTSEQVPKERRISTGIFTFVVDGGVAAWTITEASADSEPHLNAYVVDLIANSEPRLLLPDAADPRPFQGGFLVKRRVAGTDAARIELVGADGVLIRVIEGSDGAGAYASTEMHTVWNEKSTGLIRSAAPGGSRIVGQSGETPNFFEAGTEFVTWIDQVGTFLLLPAAERLIRLASRSGSNVAHSSGGFVLFWDDRAASDPPSTDGFVYRLLGVHTLKD